MWNPKPVPGWTALALSLTSAAVGVAAGYVAASKLLEKKHQEQLKAEIEDTRVYYQQMYSTPVFVADDEDEPEDGVILQAVKEATDENDPAPVDLVSQALEALEDYRADAHHTEPGDDRTPAPVIFNVFNNPTPFGDEVVDALLENRDTNFPYIITKEEFYENEGDYEQKRFTYWEGDEILVDDQEEFNPIDDVERVAGEDNLLHFGVGSGDEHVLYIRNETLDPPLDLHITRSTGKYQLEVMGLDEGEPHLRHSQPRKFRIRDE